MKTSFDTRSARFVVFVIAALGFAASSWGQASPNLGGRLGGDTFFKQDYVLNLGVQVEGQAGIPLTGMAVVTLYTASGLPVSTATTKKGKAFFAQLNEGNYYVEVEAPGFWKTRAYAIVQANVSDSMVSVSMVPAVAGSTPPYYSHAPLLPPDAQKDLSKGVDSIKANKFSAAKKQLTPVLKRAPKHPDVLYVMGILSDKMGDQAQARSYWEKTLSVDPKNILATYALGASYLKGEKFAEAAEWGAKTLELDPNSWRAHSLLASAEFRQEHYPEAASHAELAVELGKAQAANMFIILAESLAVQGNRQQAIQAVKMYLATNPSPADAEVANNLLSNLNSNADRFVVAGTEAAKRLTRAAEASVSPMVEHWIPPDVDENVPATEPGAACDLSDVLAKAGQQLQLLPQVLDRFSATETLEHQTVRENGMASGSVSVSFAYVVSIHETRPGFLNVEEYRNGIQNESIFPEHYATRGLPSQVFVFHPYYQSDFDMKCEGLARVGNGFTWQVRFSQKQNVASRMQVHYLNGHRYPVPLKGRAWIDSENFQVIRLMTDLREPIKAAGLIAQHTDITYGPVWFKKDNKSLWLPIRAEYYVQTKGHRIHRRHDFHDYLLFAVEDKQTIAAPKQTANPQ